MQVITTWFLMASRRIGVAPYIPCIYLKVKQHTVRGRLINCHGSNACEADFGLDFIAVKVEQRIAGQLERAMQLLAHRVDLHDLVLLSLQARLRQVETHGEEVFQNLFVKRDEM